MPPRRPVALRNMFRLRHSTLSPFTSTSKKQSIVCLSSTEAELYAAVEATKDIIYLRNILAELGYTQLQPT